MSNPSHIHRPVKLRAAVAALALLATAPTMSFAAPTVIRLIAPGSEGPWITGMTLESFEDVNLMSGFSVTFSNWRTASNVATADPAVTYAGLLPRVENMASYPQARWDGTHALVNGVGHDWTTPVASSVEFNFLPVRRVVGVGLSNLQSNVSTHALWLNGVLQGNLESMTGWSSGLGRNAYLLIEADAVSSVKIVCGNQVDSDAMAFDKLTVGDIATSTQTGTWGRVKALYR